MKMTILAMICASSFFSAPASGEEAPVPPGTISAVKCETFQAPSKVTIAVAIKDGEVTKAMLLDEFGKRMDIAADMDTPRVDSADQRKMVLRVSYASWETEEPALALDIRQGGIAGTLTLPAENLYKEPVKCAWYSAADAPFTERKSGSIWR